MFISTNFKLYFAYFCHLFAIWVAVDQSKGMLGAFAPQREPYIHTLDEETAPSGVLARGMYSAKLKVCAILPLPNPSPCNNTHVCTNALKHAQAYVTKNI